MRNLNAHRPPIIGLLAVALGAVALLALSGVATAKDHRGDDNGHHGRHHHQGEFELRNSGTVSSFDAATGKLTVALTGGGSVTGLVTAETRIKCEGVDDRLTRRDHGGRGTEPGDDNGGRGVEPGDDNGGQAEPADDDGGDDSGLGSSSGSGPSGEGDGTVQGAPAPAPPATPACTTASLVPGAFVGEAELRVEGSAAVFEEIELGHHS